MAKPFKVGKTWSVRVRAAGEDVYLRGHRTQAAAKKAEREHVDMLEAQGMPMGLGPEKTSVAQALQDLGKERLRFMKGARQEVKHPCGVRSVVTTLTMHASRLTQILTLAWENRCGRLRSTADECAPSP